MHRVFSISLAIISAAVSMLAIPQAKAAAGDLLVYIGTYTEGKSKGIYVCRLSADGSATEPKLAGEAKNPSFLAIHPNHHFLYAVNEIDTFDGGHAGGVSAFSIAPDGSLGFLNQVSSGGSAPCFVTVDRTGGSVLVANYSGGNAAVIHIEENGHLGKRTDFVQHKGSGTVLPRQQTALAHCSVLDPANKFVAIADLGLDKVLMYKFDSDAGTLTPNSPPSVSLKPGSGPRHIAFASDAKHAYLINEMNSTLTAFSYDASNGLLKELQTLSTLPADFKGENSTAELAIHPSGRYLYGSNRGHDSIAVYSIDRMKGTLTWIQDEPTQGKIPRGFGIEPTGRFLLAANQNSDNIAILRIDPATGRLSSTGKTISAPAPVDIKFVKVP
jgi:6-phosphogluconolactonase